MSAILVQCVTCNHCFEMGWNPAFTTGYCPLCSTQFTLQPPAMPFHQQQFPLAPGFVPFSMFASHQQSVAFPPPQRSPSMPSYHTGHMMQAPLMPLVGKIPMASKPVTESNPPRAKNLSSIGTQPGAISVLQAPSFPMSSFAPTSGQVNTLPRKPCRCGSIEHQRISHSCCPLNPMAQAMQQLNQTSHLQRYPQPQVPPQEFPPQPFQYHPTHTIDQTVKGGKSAVPLYADRRAIASWITNAVMNQQSPPEIQFADNLPSYDHSELALSDDMDDDSASVAALTRAVLA
jgi:hypothetical protein